MAKEKRFSGKIVFLALVLCVLATVLIIVIWSIKTPAVLNFRERMHGMGLPPLPNFIN